MKKFEIIWKSVDLNEDKEVFRIKEFEDVQFKDFYIRATDDDTGETLYIPYYRIYEIKQIGKTEIEIKYI
jgi:hypothetical protein